MDIFVQLTEQIIEEQGKILGSAAVKQANKVEGLSVNWEKKEIIITGNKTEVVNKLVEQYKSLFGEASVEACREAARSLIEKVPQEQRPHLLS